MKNKILIFIGLGICIILQGSNIIESLKIGNIKPDLVLLYLTYMSLNLGEIITINLGFSAGILLDLLSQNIIGINSLTLTIFSFVLNSFKTKIYTEKILSGVIVTILATIFVKLLNFFLIHLFVNKVNFYDAILKIIIPLAFYNSILSIPLFPIFTKLFTRLQWQRR